MHVIDEDAVIAHEMDELGYSIIHVSQVVLNHTSVILTLPSDQTISGRICQVDYDNGTMMIERERGGKVVVWNGTQMFVQRRDIAPDIDALTSL